MEHRAACHVHRWAGSVMLLLLLNEHLLVLLVLHRHPH
jgi:hypothetical protein